MKNKSLTVGLGVLLICFLPSSCATTLMIKEGTEIIADKEFFYNGGLFEKQLTSVSIPPTVVSIGTSAFENNAITSLSLPESITSIGERAFENNVISTVGIPSLVSQIGNRAFRGNRIEKLLIPPMVKRIGESAFSNNEISELVISEGVETIDNYAFVYNPSLMTVTIPESVTSLAPYAFDPGVTLTGKEEFARTPDTSYCRIVSNFYNRVGTDWHGNPVSIMKVDGEQVTSDVINFTPDAAKDTVLAFDINNTTYATWTNLPIKYRFMPGHAYNFVFSFIRSPTEVANWSEMLVFIVFDISANRGTYWKYAWKPGEARLTQTVLNVQQLTGVYQTTRGFEIGTCTRNEAGDYVTSSNEKIRDRFPRL
jgi:hypothetical protein